MYEDELIKLMKDVIFKWSNNILIQYPSIVAECAIRDALFEVVKECEYNTHRMFPFTRYQYDYMRKTVEEWYINLKKEFHSKERSGELSYAAEKICDMLMERK